HHQHVALEIGDHPLSLEVDVLLCAGLVRARDDRRSLRERTLHIALHYLEVLEDVVRAVLDLVGGGGGGGGGPEVEGGRLGRDHHVDRAHGASHRVTRRVSEQQHRLVHVPHV